MNVESTLFEIGEYFKKKIIDGDFEFVKCSKYTATILIDQKYCFDLWIASEPKYNFDFYHPYLITKDDVKYLSFKTQKEKLAGWRKIKPNVIDYRDKILKKEKLEQYNKLKKELEIND